MNQRIKQNKIHHEIVQPTNNFQINGKCGETKFNVNYDSVLCQYIILCKFQWIMKKKALKEIDLSITSEFNERKSQMKI